MYKSLRIYKSQKAQLHFDSIVNANSYYYYRNTNNIALHCQLTASSGDVKPLNDFLIHDLNSTVNNTLKIKNADCSIWKPELCDLKPMISFDKIFIKEYGYLFIYQLCDSENYIDEIEIYINDSFSRKYKIGGTRVYKIMLDSCVNKLSLVISGAKGNKWGISEIEIYESDYTFPWYKAPFEEFNQNVLTVEKKLYFFELLYKLGNRMAFYNPRNTIRHIDCFLKLIKKFFRFL